MCIKSALLVYTWLPSIYTPQSPQRTIPNACTPCRRQGYIYLSCSHPRVGPVYVQPVSPAHTERTCSWEPPATQYVMYCVAPQYANTPCSVHSDIPPLNFTLPSHSACKDNPKAIHPVAARSRNTCNTVSSRGYQSMTTKMLADNLKLGTHIASLTQSLQWHSQRTPTSCQDW